VTNCFWPEGEPRIHAMLVEITREGQLRLCLNNRHEVHGEISLTVPPEKRHDYRIGSIYAAHFKHAESIEENPDCFWPDGEPRIHAVITKVSEPFDCARTVEVTFKIDNRQDVTGEVALRVPSGQKNCYTVGMTYAAHFRIVSEMEDNRG
jgi:hypothetical protein